MICTRQQIAAALGVAFAAIISADSSQTTAYAVSADSDSDTVEIVGQLGGPATAITIDGDLAYVGVGPRIVVLDLSGAQPATIGSTEILPTRDGIRDLAAGDGVLYAALSSGIVAFDVADPSVPRRLSDADLPTPAKQIEYGDDHLYVMAGDTIDIYAIPLEPGAAPLAAADLHLDSMKGWQLLKADHHLLVAADRSGFAAFDVSEPSQPEVAAWKEISRVRGVAAAGDYVYLAFVDLTPDPDNPGNVIGETYVVTLDRSGDGDFAEVDRMALDTDGAMPGAILADEGKLYVYWQGKVQVLMLHDPAAPTLGGQVDIPPNLGAHDGGSMLPGVMAAYNGRLIVTFNEYGTDPNREYSGQSGAVVIDSNDPERPDIVADWSEEAPVTALGVLVGNDRLYVGEAWLDGVRIYDISRPAAPVPIGLVRMDAGLRDFAVSGDTLITLDGAGYMQLSDISDASSPKPWHSERIIGSLDVAASASHAFVAFTGEGESGEFIGQISAYELRSDSIERAYTLELDPSHVTVQDLIHDNGWLYLAVGSEGLMLVDARDPNRLRLDGAVETPHSARGLALDEPWAYVATRFPRPPEYEGVPNPPYFGGVRVVDATSKSSPTETGAFQTELSDYRGGSYEWGIAAVDDYVLLAAQEGIVRVVDVSDRASPTQVQNVAVPGQAYRLASYGQHVYVAGKDAGLLILRVNTNDGSGHRVYMPVLLRGM